VGGWEVKLSLKNVLYALAASIIILTSVIVFSGDATTRTEYGHFSMATTAAIATGFSVLLVKKQRDNGIHDKSTIALAIGLAMWLAADIHAIASEQFSVIVAFETYTIGEFQFLYYVYPALIIGGFAIFAYHLFKVCQEFAKKIDNYIVIISSVIPWAFLFYMVVFYLNVSELSVIASAEDFATLVIYMTYLIMTTVLFVPTIILLVTLRKDPIENAFWLLSAISLMSFAIGYSWESFIPIGSDYSSFVEYTDQIQWVRFAFFSIDYMVMAAGIFWHMKFFDKMEAAEIEKR
jgi:hypothetical protein